MFFLANCLFQDLRKFYDLTQQHLGGTGVPRTRPDLNAVQQHDASVTMIRRRERLIEIQAARSMALNKTPEEHAQVSKLDSAVKNARYRGTHNKSEFQALCDTYAAYKSEAQRLASARCAAVKCTWAIELPIAHTSGIGRPIVLIQDQGHAVFTVSHTGNVTRGCGIESPTLMAALAEILMLLYGDSKHSGFHKELARQSLTWKGCNVSVALGHHTEFNFRFFEGSVLSVPCAVVRAKAASANAISAVVERIHPNTESATNQ
jgi:hypothetical protein